MKKKYIAPDSETIVLTTENLIAASPTIGINKDQQVDASGSFSNRHGGWNSDDWSTSEEE